MTCLPPPWYSVFLPSRVVSGSLANDYALLSMDSYCGSNNCTKFHLKKVDAFKNNKTILVTSGMKPFIIVANNATGGNITYNFTGDPKLSAVYIKGSNKYNTYERTPLDGESFFLYNEMGQIMGTYAFSHKYLTRTIQPGVVAKQRSAVLTTDCLRNDSRPPCHLC